MLNKKNRMSTTEERQKKADEIVKGKRRKNKRIVDWERNSRTPRGDIFYLNERVRGRRGVL